MAASALLAAEVCAPLLLCCWLLCCWPDDSSDDASSTGKHPKKPVIANEWSRRSSAGRGSAASLHLPGPSGAGSGCRLVPLSAHRSHEELRGRRGSSVIDEVLARRIWRSARDLTLEDTPAPTPAPSPASPPPPRCKKHHANTKRSRRDVTAGGSDVTAGEASGDVTPRFYIGPEAPAGVLSDVIEQLQTKEEAIRCLYRAKEGKQWFNESLRGARDCTRSGARHGVHTPPLPDHYPPPSVEPAQYERGYCAQWPSAPARAPPAAPPPAGARHASDGDILAPAPALRPESGAFSESDVELSLRGAAIPTPSPRASPAHLPRETAI